MEEYTVIEILNEYTLIINYGFINSARKGDQLRIFSPGEPINYPGRDTPIGTLDIIKDTVQVTTPYQNFSICKKLNIREIEILNPLSNFIQKTIEEKKLNVSEKDISHRKIPKPTPIKIGDLAIVIPD